MNTRDNIATSFCANEEPQVIVLEPQTQISEQERQRALINASGEIWHTRDFIFVLNTFTECSNLGYLKNDINSLEFIKNCLYQMDVTFNNFFQAKRKIRGKVDLTNTLKALNNILSGCQPISTNAILQHEIIIQIIKSLNHLRIPLRDNLKNNLTRLLQFKDVADEDTPVMNDLLACARAGIDIKPIINDFIARNYGIKNTKELADLTTACFIHDTNILNDADKIDTKIIKSLFMCIDSNHKNLSENNIKKTLGNKKRCDSNDARSFLQAAAYYGHHFPEKIKKVFEKVVNSKNVSNVSSSQLQLTQILTHEFSGNSEIQVIGENAKGDNTRLLGVISADILLKSNDNKIIDIEFDADIFHNYNDLSLMPIPTFNLRENIARDAVLKKYQIEVMRFDQEDLDQYYQNSTNSKLRLFIQRIRDTYNIPLPATTLSPLMTNSVQLSPTPKGRRNRFFTPTPANDMKSDSSDHFTEWQEVKNRDNSPVP